MKAKEIITYPEHVTLTSTDASAPLEKQEKNTSDPHEWEDYGGPEGSEHCNLRKHMQMQKFRTLTSSIWQHMSKPAQHTVFPGDTGNTCVVLDVRLLMKKYQESWTNFKNETKAWTLLHDNNSGVTWTYTFFYSLVWMRSFRRRCACISTKALIKSRLKTAFLSFLWALTRHGETV